MALTSAQKAFLSECEQEFANRYTMEDEEFVKVFNAEIPTPPIMNNWYPRNRRNNSRFNQGGRYRDRRSDNRYNTYDRGYDRDRMGHYNQDRSSSYEDYREREDRWDNQDHYRDRSRDRY